MSEGQVFEIHFNRPDSSYPWGFRLEGGVDLPMQLNIQKINPGSIAERVGLQSGDLVLQINQASSKYMQHEDAKMEIIRSGNDFTIVVERRGQTVWRPKTTPTGPEASGADMHMTSHAQMQPMMGQSHVDNNPEIPMVTHTSLAANKQDMRPIGTSHNAAPMPFGAQPPASVVTQSQGGRTKRVVHNQFNSPMGLYTDQEVSDTFQGRVQDAQAAGPPGFKSIQAPTPGVPGPSRPQTQASMYCGACGEFIKGVFVKVQNKVPMHPNCLKCFKCGVGLRNIGYFYIDEKLYCETHAKQVATPPGPDMKPVASYQ